jgi:hypothetical protein
MPATDPLSPLTQVALLLPAGVVPDGTPVTKRTGEKEYHVTRAIRIHEGPRVHELKAEPGTVFLMADNTGNAVPASTLVIAKMEAQEALELLQDLLEGGGR